MSNTTIPISSLASKIEISINSRTGWVGLGKINPEERLNIAGNFQLNLEDTGAGDVYIQASNKDGAGNNAKVNLNLITLEQDSGASGDIVIRPGDGINFNSTGKIILKQKVQVVNPGFQGWSITSITQVAPGFIYANDFLGTTQPAPYNFPAVDYDQMLIAYTAGTGNLDLTFELEGFTVAPTGSFTNRARAYGYNSITVIIPAGLRWRLKMQNTSVGNTSCTMSLFPLGLRQ